MSTLPSEESLAEATPGGGAVATATAPPGATLSPGPWGEDVFNPIVKAEFRRWRARPVTYLSIVLVALASIILLYYIRTNRLPDLVAGMKIFGFDVGAFLSGQVLGGGSRGWMFGFSLMSYIIRPSTIIPLLMTWRALASFRSGGMYRAFRMTFLTPGEFLWGVIATPFVASALILVLYTGLVLGPDMMARGFSRPPDRGSTNLWLTMGGILFEGSLNGMLICFIALLVGLLTDARLSALGVVILITIGVQALQASPVLFPDFWPLNPATIRDLVLELPAPWPDRLSWTRGLETYIHWGLPKLVLCIVLWRACVVVIRSRAEE